MSGIVGYKKSAWDGATKEQRAFLKSIMNTLKLGVPALGTIGGEEWYVFSDWRINSTFVENLAWGNSAIPLITSEPVRDYPLTETGEYEVPIYEWVETEYFDEFGEPYDPPQYYSRRVDTGETRTVEGEYSLGDPLMLAADAQGSVPWFTARSSLPVGWVPDSSEGV